VIHPTIPASGPVAESQGMEPGPSSGPLPAAEQLLKDMEDARSSASSSMEQPKQAPTLSTAEELARELESLRQATAPQGPGEAPAASLIQPDLIPPTGGDYSGILPGQQLSRRLP
jgi:hypothetical protein